MASSSEYSQSVGGTRTSKIPRPSTSGSIPPLRLQLESKNAEIRALKQQLAAKQEEDQADASVNKAEKAHLKALENASKTHQATLNKSVKQIMDLREEKEALERRENDLNEYILHLQNMTEGVVAKIIEEKAGQAVAEVSEQLEKETERRKRVEAENEELGRDLDKFLRARPLPIPLVARAVQTELLPVPAPGVAMATQTEPFPSPFEVIAKATQTDPLPASAPKAIDPALSLSITGMMETAPLPAPVFKAIDSALSLSIADMMETAPIDSIPPMPTRSPPPPPGPPQQPLHPVQVTVNVIPGQSKSINLLKRAVCIAVPSANLTVQGSDEGVNEVQTTIARLETEEANQKKLVELLLAENAKFKQSRDEALVSLGERDGELAQAKLVVSQLRDGNEALRIQAEINKEVIARLGNGL